SPRWRSSTISGKRPVRPRRLPRPLRLPERLRGRKKGEKAEKFCHLGMRVVKCSGLEGLKDMGQRTNSGTSPGTLAQLVRTAQLVWRLLLDPRVPILYKLIVPLVVIYVLSPLDLIPDLIPIAGQLDDVGVIFFGLRFFIQVCPPDVVMEHRRALAGGSNTPREEYVDGTYRVVDDD
ncbi:MAG: YkvA family protein, partial [Rudaea sp.]